MAMASILRPACLNGGWRRKITLRNLVPRDTNGFDPI